MVPPAPSNRFVSIGPDVITISPIADDGDSNRPPSTPYASFLSPASLNHELRPHSYSEPGFLSRHGPGIPATDSDFSEVSDDELRSTFTHYSDLQYDLATHLEAPTTTSTLRRSHSMFMSPTAESFYSTFPMSLPPASSHMSFDEDSPALMSQMQFGWSFNLSPLYSQTNTLPLDFSFSTEPDYTAPSPVVSPSSEKPAHIDMTPSSIHQSMMEAAAVGTGTPFPETGSPPSVSSYAATPQLDFASPSSSEDVESESQSKTQRASASVASASVGPNEIDRNGRKRRVYTKTQFTCSHCPRKFSITNMEIYCRHVLENNIQREYKCPETSCPWSVVGFQRKLERDRHFTRKHGVPQYECRFWAGSGREKFEGAGVCTTQWHADAGNRTRHERSVHGYYVATHRGRTSSLDEVEMIKVTPRQ